MIDFNNFSAIDRRESFSHFINQHNVRFESVVESAKNDQSDRSARHSLLFLDVFIGRKHHDKACFFGFIQQVAVLKPCPSHFENAFYLMFREMA